MSLRILSSGPLSGLAGAAMLAVSAHPAPAFTLYSPSLERPHATEGVQQAWYDRWGRWHPNYYYRPYYYNPYDYRPYSYYYPYYGYRAYYPYYYYRPVLRPSRNCWRNGWGTWNCYWR
jgi:hypothetical protein